VSRNPDTGVCEDKEIRSPYSPRLANPYAGFETHESKNIFVYDILGRKILSLPNDPTYSKDSIERMVLEHLPSDQSNKILFINYINKKGKNETSKIAVF